MAHQFLRGVLRPLAGGLFPSTFLNQVTKSVVGGGIPVLVPWAVAAGAAGAWVVWPGLTDSFKAENGIAKHPDDYTPEEEMRAYAYRPFNVKNR